MIPTRQTFDQDRAAGRADMVEARLGWLAVRSGDVLYRRGASWATDDGRVVPGWAVRHHWGSAFVPVGWSPDTPRSFLAMRADVMARMARRSA
jgi:hypothetical protein